jgi:hypothetical protein
MRSFIFFTHPDSSADESSLSAHREGEQCESICMNSITGTKTHKQ